MAQMFILGGNQLIFSLSQIKHLKGKILVCSFFLIKNNLSFWNSYIVNFITFGKQNSIKMKIIVLIKVKHIKYTERGGWAWGRYQYPQLKFSNKKATKRYR